MLSLSGAWFATAARSAFLTERANLFGSANFFVNTHGNVFDDSINHSKPAFALLDDVAIRTDREKHVIPFSLLINLVCKAAFPHFLELVDFSASGSDDAFKLSVDLVNLFFRGHRIDNEHDFVISHLVFLLRFAVAATSRVS